MSNSILIIVSLRGGADALNMLVPYRESEYYRLRPSLAIAQPGSSGESAIDLDGRFGIHPALAPLLPIYQRGELAFLQAVGWPGDTHSHFEAWDQIESGSLDQIRPNSGWLARYLQLRSATPTTPLRAVAFGELLPKLLTGALGVSPLRSLADFRLATSNSQSIAKALGQLYQTNTSLSSVAMQTLDALAAIDEVGSTAAVNHSKYPATTFGEQLASVERLIRSQVGLEAASVELNGWDTHIMAGGNNGPLARLLTELAKGLNAFCTNLADYRDRITLVVMSEFGRRVAENGSGGSDHGQGGLMIFWGNRVRGGHVYGDWPGLSEQALAAPGDLTITTDFRDALGELVAAELGEKAVAQIFPGHRRQRGPGLIAA